MGKTIVEKILAKGAGKPEVSPGDYVQVGATKFILFPSDRGTRVPTAFKRLGWDKLFDPTKVIVGPAVCGSWWIRRVKESPREAHRANREWAKQMGVPDENNFELGRSGIDHHLAVEKAWAMPGSVYLSAHDGHSITLGGIGSFGSNLSAGAPFFMRFGWMWFRVPESIKFIIKGKLQDGVMGRDVIEYILGQIGPQGAIYQVMEFTGPVMDEMSMDGRLSMCCLAMFTGAKLGIVNPSQEIIDWFRARTDFPFEPQFSDPDAHYIKTYEYDGSKIEPQVVLPSGRHHVKNISEVERTEVTSAFIGSCASGRDEDMRIAARILKGRKVHPSVMFNVTPGSSEAMLRMDKEGVIQTLLEAGVFFVAPGCSMCNGASTPLHKDDICISTSTLNYPGRMGDENASVYLASAATVAASAVEGKITDPRKYL